MSMSMNYRLCTRVTLVILYITCTGAKRILFRLKLFYFLQRRRKCGCARCCSDGTRIRYGFVDACVLCVCVCVYLFSFVCRYQFKSAYGARLHPKECEQIMQQVTTTSQMLINAKQ
jgi:hypothetical protein